MQKLALLIALVCVALIAWWVRRGPRELDHLPGGRVPVPEQSAVLEDPGTTGRSATARGSPEQPTPTSTAAFRVRVVSAPFGVPLRAWVEVVGLRGAFTAADGRLQVDGGDPRPRRVLAAAAGYVDAHVEELPPGQEHELRLEGARASAVQVDSAAGGAIAGASVTWRSATGAPERENVTRWIDSRAQSDGTPILTHTDASGRSGLPLGSPALAEVEHPRSHARTTVRVVPGETVRLVLPEEALHVRFVDARDDRPLAGLEIDTWRPRNAHALSQAHRTDADGLLALAPTSFPILVRRAGTDLWTSELVCSSSAVRQVGLGGDIRTQLSIERVPAEEPLVVRVRRCGGELLLLDERTGAPIEGRVGFDTRRGPDCAAIGSGITACTLRSPRIAQSVEGQNVRSKAGLVSLPCTVPGTDSLSRQKARQVVVQAEGYAPVALAIADLPSAAADHPLEVRLVPGEPRTLRVVQSDGRPYKASVTVYSPQGDVIVCGPPRLDESGVLGPFDWFGGELWVKCAEGRDWPFRFGAEQVAAAAELSLVVPVETGTLEVVDVPRGAPSRGLIAKTGIGLGGIEYPPTRLEDGRCAFEHLPVGTYMVGPRAWLESAEMQSFTVGQHLELEDHPTRLVVSADAVTRTSWLDTWGSGVEVQGTVHVVGGSGTEPILVPLYGGRGASGEVQSGVAPTMIFGRRSPRLVLDPDGTYRIRAEDPLPLLIAVCVPTGGSWGTVNDLRLVETLVPGESIEVRVGTVELTWTAAKRPARLWIRLQPDPLRFRHPLQCFHDGAGVDWEPERVLRLDDVPLGAHQVKLGSTVHEFEVQAGRITRLEWNGATLQPVER